MSAVAIDVYSKDGTRRIGSIFVPLVCGEIFCDSCGDCLDCYDGDPCYGSGEPAESHSFLVYADDPRYFRRTA